MQMKRRTFLLATTAIAFAGMAMAQTAEVADTIYSGGPILTMDDTRPRVEALAVKSGRILALGPLTDILKLKGEGTRMVDLGGRTLLPGFVDPHGHVTGGGIQAMSANMLSPTLPASRRR
jgi:predicted amidohydrolase YtcJ